MSESILQSQELRTDSAAYIATLEDPVAVEGNQIDQSGSKRATWYI
jgi:hypothetical protein